MKKLLLLALMAIPVLSAQAQCIVKFVSVTGLPSNQGTMTSPLDITTAFLTAGDGDIIRIGDGIYSINAPLVINANNLIIEGGYLTSDNWRKSSLAGTTTINRTNIAPQGAMNEQRLVAISADGKSGFELHDLTIITANAPSSGVSTYGVHLANCSDYTVTRCVITAGNAGNGMNGSPGAPGIIGNPGNVGSAGAIDDTCYGGAGGSGGSGGGTGGASTAGGVNPAACDQAGGSGAAGATSSSIRNGGAGGGGGAGGEGNKNGGTGGTGGGVNGGAVQTGGGTAGTWGDPGGAGGNGTAGTIGANGTNGAAGSAGVLGQFYQPQQAGNGTDGAGGKGGVGGGGGGGQSCFFCIDGSGNGGGGGGGGGQGGAGGIGGFGGAGSFGIYLYNNGVNTNLIDCTVTSGSAGSGGSGGTGGVGANGGTGGNGSSVGTSEVGKGGNGGAGGKGGNGGNGGNGMNGISVAVQLVSGTPLDQSISNFNLAAQPEIRVEYKNCTNQLMSFEAVTLPQGSGVAAWNFGANASSPTSADNSASTSYTSTGRNTITQGSEVYTGFINISCAGFMTTVDTTICYGNTYTIGGNTYVTSNTYVDVLTSVLSGCDSTVTTNLTILPSMSGVTVSNGGVTLTSQTSGAIYQWIDCNNGNTPIAGANSQSFVATQNGSYAVQVTKNGCTQTSSCTVVNSVGIDELFVGKITVYPNPSKGVFNLSLGENVEYVKYTISDCTGQQISEGNVYNLSELKIEIDESAGVYFIQLQLGEENYTLRLIKN